jgi:hypothetical protein
VNLGIALLRLGERESATARFKESVAASVAALEEMAREGVLLDLAVAAGTQNNLGAALETPGERVGRRIWMRRWWRIAWRWRR